MDRLNNNNENPNSYETNFGSFGGTCDDILNYDESRTAGRITHLNYHQNRHTIPPFNSQEYSRSNIDRIKDRQIAILIQKNNFLQNELLSLRQKCPTSHDYSGMGQLNNGINNRHLQIKLLTTALSEKFEELRQAREELRQLKKEYKLVMQERTTVHRELQDQIAEIDMLKEINKKLQDQLNFRASSLDNDDAFEDLSGGHRFVSSDSESTEALKSKISALETTIQNLTTENEKSYLQLNAVLDKCYKLKMALSNGMTSKREFRKISGSKIHEEVISGNAKMIDLKMTVLKISCEDSNVLVKSGKDFHKSFINIEKSTNNDESQNTNDFSTADSIQSLVLRPNDQILEIEGTCVVQWLDSEILEFLGRYDPNSFLKVIVSRKVQTRGKFLSWQLKVNTTSLKTLSLSPLWMVTKPDGLDENVPMFKLGDILQLDRHDGSAVSNVNVSVNIIRLNPIPVKTNDFEKNNLTDRDPINPFKTNAHEYIKPLAFSSSDPLSVLINTNLSYFPVLPAKQKLLLLNDISLIPSHQPISDYDLSQYSNTSECSAPPVPPRSTTSLQHSFIENIDHSHTCHADTEDVQESREFAKEEGVFVLNENDNLNLSVQSAIQCSCNNNMNTTSRELMSASFNCTSEFSTHKIPKLGKCRKVLLTVPSKVFCLKDLGLHLLHGNTEETLKSKSDVDVSVINQIFIRNVEINSLAQSAGLVEGDEIITINNHPVSKMTAEETENAFLTNPFKPDKQKYSLLIKVQFNPLKMQELFKEKNLIPLGLTLPSVRFTRSMYDETHSSRSIYDNNLPPNLHIRRSSSNLNVINIKEFEHFPLNHDIMHHLQTQPRIIRVNLFTVLKLIKIMGGSNVGIFVTNVIYKDSSSEMKIKESIGNRLGVGDKILDVNGQSFDKIIGEEAVEYLNKLSHPAVMKVIYDPTGLLSINSDPFRQEKFYMEATFSFSELNNTLTTFSGKRDKATSVGSRLDHLTLNISFVRNYHLTFEKNDILLVDATILPSSMTRTCQDDKNNANDWHAWVVDKKNNKIRQGMIPSAFWIEKMVIMHSKSFKFHGTDRNVNASMRSTPSSPISETNEFLSSGSTGLQNGESKLFHTRHSSIGHKLFSRMSFKSHLHTKSVSGDSSNKGITFQKFRPVKRFLKVTNCKRPVILLGPHSDTVCTILASTRPQEYVMTQPKIPLNYSPDIHQISSVIMREEISKLHKQNIFPIIVLLKYTSAKQIRQTRFTKASQIKISKSEGLKLFSQIKELENIWSDVINEFIFPSKTSDICEAVISTVVRIHAEDIWIPIERYQYSD